MTDDDLRKLWRDAGGSFHGPRVETGTMPEEKLLPFLRRLVGERSKLVEANAKLKADNKEMGRSFDLRWGACRRATEMWQAANPGNDLVWPDYADLCVWLLGQLASAREMRKRLDRRIRNQRIANRETWEIVESRRKWLGSDTARRSVIRHIGVIRELRAEIETMREAAKGQLVVVNVAQSEATLAKASAAGAMSMLKEVRDECVAARKALAGLELYFERPDEDSLTRFERIAEVFQKETGHLRPGKDCRLESPEVRQAAYDRWVAEKLAAARAVLGPDPAPTQGEDQRLSGEEKP